MFDLHIGTSIVYSQSLSSGITPSSQFSAWTSFQSLLIVRPYSSLTISGSNDPIGITLANGTIVAAIAHALRTRKAISIVSSNGYSWAVRDCGSGFERTVTDSICGCSTANTIRSCIVNSNWVGINSVTVVLPLRHCSSHFNDRRKSSRDVSIRWTDQWPGVPPQRLDRCARSGEKEWSSRSINLISSGRDEMREDSFFIPLQQSFSMAR